ncbi:MAG: Gfo/Idh/MocA family oxidoreductase [Leptospiraceae bacterium]|nr:Gfo/Idh/MocA family oxidoreductase [Leptospiraceae bacterium]
MANQTRKLKMGIIGTGHMGQYHVNVVAGMANHELVGIYDSNPDRAKEIAAKYEVDAFESVESLLDQVEAVTVAVPTFLHYEIAKAALEKGVHVLLEKPITQTLEQALEITQIARSKNLFLQVGHVERFNGAVMELGKIVTEPRLIQSHRLSPFTPRISDVGVVLDLLIHDLDIVINLVRAPVRDFQAMGSKIMSNSEDVAVINLAFENGCIACLTGSRVSQYKARTLTVTQDKSYIFLNYANQDIEIHRQASSAYLMTPDEIKYSQESFVEKLYVHKDNPLRSEHQHFYDCIVKGETPMVQNEKDIETLRIALESLKSINGSTNVR